ncbi:TBC1 domain family member 19 isoform X3 [Hydra vulgaris]|uniref:TBC1 domain family member 19 isoform X3 n=1 Tax=Hydra vulgaris TaxID=6087 RepID=UPI0032EA0DB8
MSENKELVRSFINDLYIDFINSNKFSNLQRYLEADLSWSASGEVKDVKKQLKMIIKDSDYYVDIENMVFAQMNKKNKKSRSYGILPYLKKSEELWLKRIMESVNKMCTELKIYLSQKRTVSQQVGLDENILSFVKKDCNKSNIKLRPVYSATDFFEMLISIKNNNLRDSVRTSLYLMKTCLHVKDFLELKSFYSAMYCLHQMNFKDQTQKEIFYINKWMKSENDWIKLGNAVINKKTCSSARQYLKQGCPASLRKQIWLILLNIKIHDEDMLYYFQLKKSALEYDLFVDHLLRQDVQLTASNSNLFFVFEDLLYQTLLVFSRDDCFLNYLEELSITPFKYLIKDKIIEDRFNTYPPCGILPFHGFSMLAAPLCYIYEKPEELYFAFRELYGRYFIKLHSISSNSQKAMLFFGYCQHDASLSLTIFSFNLQTIESILSISSLFESLLISKEAALFKHLMDIGSPPLKLAFNWLMFVYSGYLSAEETLQLWDIILGFDSLDILAVVAVAIFEFRRESLMSATNLKTAEFR